MSSIENCKKSNTSEEGELNRIDNAIFFVRKDDLLEFAKTFANQSFPKPVVTSEKVLEKPISQREACVFFGKTRQTLISWRKKGIIKGHQVGGRIYYMPSELLTALKCAK